MSLTISTSAAASDLSGLPIGPQCRSKLAPVLCAIKHQRQRTNRWRVMAGNRKLGLPTTIYTDDRSQRIADLYRWRQRRINAKAFVNALWNWAQQPRVWCVHTHESADWHEPGSPGGGFQYIDNTWDRAGGQQYAPTAPQATATEQIRVTKHYTALHGWGEWSTSAGCGL